MRKASANGGIREIAAATGYNISTVSRALNNRPGVSPAAAASILQTARELGYRSGTTPVYAILLPDTKLGLAWYSLNMLDAMRQEAIERNCLLEIVFSDQADILRERNISGILSFDFSSQAVRNLKVVLPVVCVNDFSWHIADIYSVCSDIGRGIRSAVALLAAYGHRKIGLLINGDRNTESNRERTAAFEECRSVYGLDPVSSVHFREYGTFDQPIPYLYASIREMTGRGLTAIINCGESESVEALAAARLCGLRVPEDLSVVSIDGTRWAELYNPPLTAIKQDSKLLAKAGGEELLQAIDGNSEPHAITIPTTLKSGGSVKIDQRCF